MPVQICYPKLVASRPILRIRLPCSCMQHRRVRETLSGLELRLGPYGDGLQKYQALNLQKNKRSRTEVARGQS